MSQLSNYVRRLGGAYLPWLQQHDALVAANTKAEIIKALQEADSKKATWAVNVIEGLTK
jgi:hypothetical protein